ncbi:hypothetical protein V5O48_007242 [Marasmius crinis-equi]|uniref:RGS domain-containing protein n=1 Tax=Marasmius crinis-equi TaxID=585013 RepID=A0ABR3FH98_9AGAR
MTVASLEQLFDTVDALPTKAGKSYFSYLAPLSNNPRRTPNSAQQDSLYTFVDTLGTPARMHTFMQANTRPSMGKEKAHTQLTEYFNLFIDEDTTFFAEDKLKLCRALLCVESVTNTSGIPSGIVQMSQDTIKCCLKIQSETERRFNRYNAVADLQSPLVRSSRTGEDNYVLMFQTKKLMNLSAARGSAISSLSMDPFDQDEISPSVLKQNRVNEMLAESGIDDPLFLDDLSDPRGLWESTIRGMNAPRCILVEQPKIYNSAGELIHPSNYAEEIQDGQLLLAEISFSMWNFSGSKMKPKKSGTFAPKELSNGRVYHITIEELHLLDPQPDEHKAWLIEHVADGYIGRGDEVDEGTGTLQSDTASVASTEKTMDSDDATMAGLEEDKGLGRSLDCKSDHRCICIKGAEEVQAVASAGGLASSIHAPGLCQLGCGTSPEANHILGRKLNVRIMGKGVSRERPIRLINENNLAFPPRKITGLQVGVGGMAANNVFVEA